MLQLTTCNGMQLIATLVSKLRALEPPMASLGVALVSADVESGAQAAKSTDTFVRVQGQRQFDRSFPCC